MGKHHAVKSSVSWLHITSLMCVFHCVVTPMLVVTAPLFGQLLDNPVLEIGALLGSILCGMLVIYKGYCTHKRRHTVLLFAAGAIVWVANSILEHYGVPGEQVYLLIGTAIVLLSYYINHRYLRCCCKA